MKKVYTKEELLETIQVLYKAILYDYVGAIRDDQEVKQVLKKFGLDLSEDAYYDMEAKHRVSKLKKDILEMQAELTELLEDYPELKEEE